MELDNKFWYKVYLFCLIYRLVAKKEFQRLREKNCLRRDMRYPKKTPSLTIKNNSCYMEKLWATRCRKEVSKPETRLQLFRSFPVKYLYVKVYLLLVKSKNVILQHQKKLQFEARVIRESLLEKVMFLSFFTIFYTFYD